MEWKNGKKKLNEKIFTRHRNLFLIFILYLLPLFAKIALSTLSSDVFAASKRDFRAFVLDWKKWKKKSEEVNGRKNK